MTREKAVRLGMIGAVVGAWLVLRAVKPEGAALKAV
jgi:hypothetical protein